MSSTHILNLISVIVFFCGHLVHAESTAHAKSQIENYLFKKVPGARKGPRTDGIVISQSGSIIYEKYDRGYDEKKLHVMWSVSKTVMSLLYGVALKENLVKLDQSICDFITDIPNKNFCNIKIRHVLTWTTSIEWKEDYEKAVSHDESSILAMLYGEGKNDMAKFVLTQPLVAGAKPGEIWRYSSGDSVLASYLLKKIFKTQDMQKLFKEKLFDPLEIIDWRWETDPQGTIAGAYYFYTTPRGMVRIGELLLGKGSYKGKQIFSSDYYQFMTTVPEAYIKNRWDEKEHIISGGHIWLNKHNAGELQSDYSFAPEDMMIARGHWGQYLVVIPSLNAIVARTGDTRDGSVRSNDFMRNILPLLNGKETPPPSKQYAKSQTSPPKIKFKNGMLKLGMSFVAKAFCSCIFVTKNTEAECRDYASLDQVSPRLTIDNSSQTTSSSLYFLFEKTAQYQGEGKGCIAL